MLSTAWKPVAFLVAGIAAGVFLALASLASQTPMGWLGAVSLIGWAVVARKRWSALEATNGLEPGAPERVLWLRMAGTTLILGHLAAAIVLVGSDLRVGHGNSLAVDSWMLIAAQAIAAVLFRDDSRSQDERHAAIAARGMRVGYATLIAVLVPLIAWLTFPPRDGRAIPSNFVMANLLVVLLLTSYAALLVVQLVDYARDTGPAVDDESSVP